MPPLLTRLELEIIGVLIIVAVVLLWLGFHDANVKREATAPVLASIKAAEDAASAAAAIKAAQVDAEQAGNLHEANAQNAARAVDARDLAAVVRGLHDDAAVRPRAASGGASAPGAGQAGIGDPPDVVPGQLYRAALSAFADTAEDAAGLASGVGGLRSAGGLCARDYDAFGTLKP